MNYVRSNKYFSETVVPIGNDEKLKKENFIRKDNFAHIFPENRSTHPFTNNNDLMCMNDSVIKFNEPIDFEDSNNLILKESVTRNVPGKSAAESFESHTILSPSYGFKAVVDLEDRQRLDIEDGTKHVALNADSVNYGIKHSDCVNFNNSLFDSNISMSSEVKQIESTNLEFMEKLTKYETRYATIIREHSNTINNYIEEDLDLFDLS